MNKNTKIYILIASVCLLMAGAFIGDALRVLGIKRSVGTKGGMIRITGSCQTRSGGQVVLTNDTVRLIQEKANEIEVVFINDAKYLRCNLASVYVESFSVFDLFEKSKIKTESSKNTRDVEKDPIMDNLKKTVLISGFCTNNGSEIILNDRVMDVLDIREIDGDFETLGLVKTIGKEVKCRSSRSKMTQIHENDVQSFVEKEMKGRKTTPNSYKGRIVAVTGACLKKVEGKVKKNIIVDLSATPVKITDEVFENGVVQSISGKAKDEDGKIISIECSREIDRGLLLEEIENSSTETTKSEVNVEGVRTTSAPLSLKITGKCKITGGSDIELYEQRVKIVNSEQSQNGSVSRITGKLKLEGEEVKTITCDKASGVIFEVTE